MIHPAIIQRRASCVGDLQQTFACIDASRLEYLAGILKNSGCPGTADLALRWAEEHRLLAATLNGERAVGGEDNPFANAEFAPRHEDLPVKVRA
jgi:hypothetical protein